jgi:hypothetical protein
VSTLYHAIRALGWLHRGDKSKGSIPQAIGLVYANRLAARAVGMLIAANMHEISQDKGVGGVVDEVIVKRFENVIAKADEVLNHVNLWQYGELFYGWRRQGLKLLESIFDTHDPYVRDFEKTVHPNANDDSIPVLRGRGILRSALADVSDGYLWNLKERVHGEVFDDFLVMASSLVGDGYIDAAAVIAVGTLEEHMRQLCAKKNVATTVPKQSGSTEPKKASAMNRDLWQQGVYDKPDWRQVDAWLDIRNDPAHGHYKRYSQQQVELMIEGIRGFFLRNPA